MTNPMLAELDEVVRLMDAATPGPWESASRGRYYVGQQEDEASVHGADDADIDEVSNVSPLHLADTIRGDCYKPDADLIAAAVNFLRTHHATLADMAKRLEAAERDAPALTDAQCDAIYSALDDYGREVDHFEFGLPWHCDGGPEKRREVIRAAIDATQGGEG